MNTELLEALAALPADAQLTISVSVSDLRAALSRSEGKIVLTPREAAAEFGWTPRHWQKLAASGQLAAAWQDGGNRGRWRLPREACARYVQQLMQAEARGEQARKPRGPRAKQRQAKAEAASAARSGSEDRTQGSELDSGSAPLEWQKVYNAPRPVLVRLAPDGTEGSNGS